MRKLSVRQQSRIDQLAAQFKSELLSDVQPQADLYLANNQDIRDELRTALLCVKREVESNTEPFHNATNREPLTAGDGSATILKGTQWKMQKPDSSSRIGPYKLLHKLGQGGMGEVYAADQLEPVKRRVALKLIRAGRDGKQAIARFEVERQALAIMDHPNIARVLDAGISEEGQPYFAMELVYGMPITKYCDKHRSSIRERLQLFVQVCRAVQHAHQKGILHRDLKPSNILVSMRDGTAIAKVIDFGLAKAIQAEQRLTDKTLYTEIGQVIGTLEYMSPEQAEMNELGLDTRTDVYSLGILLYELLTGTTPLRRETLHHEAIYRVIQRIVQEDVPPPSRRLSDSSDKIDGISNDRQVDASRYAGMLRGELDWITLKSLSKERDRRYDGAGSLADDVENYLDGDVVFARPPSAIYRFRKAVKRNKAIFAVSLAIACSLIAGIVGTSFMWVEAKKESARANRYAYDSDMQLAQNAWNAGRLSQLKELLDQYRDKSSLQGFEWHFWEGLTRKDVNTLQQPREGNHLRAAEFSSQGDRIAFVFSDGRVEVRNAKSGEELWSIQSPNPVSDVAFNSNDNLLAYSEMEGAIVICSVNSGDELRRLNGAPIPLCIAFESKGNRLACIYVGTQVVIWDAETGDELRRLEGGSHDSEQSFVDPELEFNSESQMLLAYERSKMSENTVPVDDKMIGKRSAISSFYELNPFEQGGLSKRFILWDTESGNEMVIEANPRPNRELPITLGLTPDGLSVRRLQGSKVFEYKVDVSSKSLKEKELGSLDVISDQIAFLRSSRGVTKIAGFDRGLINIWNVEAGMNELRDRVKLMFVLKEFGEKELSLLEFSPDGAWIVAGASDGTVKIFDAKDQEECKTSKMRMPNKARMLLGPDSNAVALFDQTNGAVRILGVEDRQSHVLLNKPGATRSVRFSSDGKRLLVLTVDSDANANTSEGVFNNLAVAPPLNVASVSEDSSSEEFLASEDGALQETGKVEVVDSGGMDFGSKDLQEFGFGDWSEISRPSLSTDTSLLVDSASFVLELADNQVATMHFCSRDTGNTLFEYQLRDAVISSNVALSKNGRQAFFSTTRGASTSNAFRLVAIDSISGEEKAVTVEDHGFFEQLEVDEFDKMLIAVEQFAGTKKQQIALVSLSTGEIVRNWHTFEQLSRIHCVGISRKAGLIVASIANLANKEQLVVWDIDDQQMRFSIPVSSPVTCVRFSPDGNRIVSAGGQKGRDAVVSVWNSQTGRQLLTLEGHSGRVLDVAFRSQSTQIVSVGGDGTLKVWGSYKSE